MYQKWHLEIGLNGELFAYGDRTIIKAKRVERVKWNEFNETSHNFVSEISYYYTEF